MDLTHTRERASEWLWHLVPASMRMPFTLLGRAVMHWLNEGGPQLGAAIAFYTMFALAPLLIIGIAIAGAVFGEEAARGHIVGQIEGLVGQNGAQGIEAMIRAAWRDPRGPMATAIAVGTLLVAASGVFAQLRRALDDMAQIDLTQAGVGAMVRARLVAFALVLGFGFLAIVSLLLSAALAALGATLAALFPALAELLALLDLAVSAGVLTLAFAALLRWLPDRPWRMDAIWVGAFSSSVLFAIGKHLIGLYLARSTVASSYGAAGSFVVVMLWVYYSAQILLFGAALAHVIDRHKRQRQERIAAANKR